MEVQVARSGPSDPATDPAGPVSSTVLSWPLLAVTVTGTSGSTSTAPLGRRDGDLAIDSVGVARRGRRGRRRLLGEALTRGLARAERPAEGERERSGDEPTARDQDERHHDEDKHAERVHGSPVRRAEARLGQPSWTPR